VLRLAARVGALDGVEPARPPARAWDDGEIAAELRATAAAGFVLARNDGLLPLDRGSLRRVAVIGPNAAVARTLGGGSATVFPRATVSPLDGLRSALGPGVEVGHEPGVRTHTRLPAAAPGALLLPDGAGPGARVRFLAADGTELGAEDRLGAVYAWQGVFGAGVPARDVAAIELTTRIRAEGTGEHVIGASGVGRFRLVLDGAEAFDARLTLAPGADPAEAHMRPPQRGVPVELEAGQEVELLLRHELEPGTGGTSFEISGAAFQLNVDPPAAPDDAGLEAAVALAREADVAIVVVGTTEEVESEGFDRASLELPGGQDELVRRVAAANPRTAVVVNAGAPVLLPWIEDVPATLLAWFPGQEFGDALADVLLGEREAGGRLPTSWPASAAGLPSPEPVDGVLRYDEGLAIGYRAADREPLLPFGHGLGYTAWEYLDATGADGSVRVRLRNAGERPGREVVQVYASRPDSAIERPPRWLVGFAGVEADPGEEVVVDVAVPARRLAHWDTGAGGWAIEPGRFGLEVGHSSGDLRLRAALRAD
jgi:beta-glucosidase